MGANGSEEGDFTGPPKPSSMNVYTDSGPFDLSADVEALPMMP